MGSGLRPQRFRLLLPLVSLLLGTCATFDPDRVFLVGVSMGGMGAWSLPMDYPDLFAAVAPISGGVYSPPMRRDFAAITAIPFRVYHDEVDPSMPLSRDAEAVVELREAGGSVELIVTRFGRHYIQDFVFASGGLFEWFASVH